jgi:hypothetical protein
MADIVIQISSYFKKSYEFSQKNDWLKKHYEKWANVILYHWQYFEAISWFHFTEYNIQKTDDQILKYAQL